MAASPSPKKDVLSLSGLSSDPADLDPCPVMLYYHYYYLLSHSVVSYSLWSHGL